MKDKKTFGSFIKEKRINKNYSQKDLAELLYVTESAVSKWERGITYPDITLISDICKVLDISEKELIQSSDDNEYRRIKHDSVKFNRIKKILFWSFNICYMIALLTCFIVNLAVGHTLSWFFIVLASVLVAYTFCPTITWICSRYKKTIFIGSSILSLFLLFLTCSIYTNNYWFMIATLGVLTGYFIIFYPILFTEQKKHLEKSKYDNLSKWFLLTYLLGMLLLTILLLVVINCYHTFNILLALIITLGCFIIPILFGVINLFGNKKLHKIITLSLVGVLVLSFVAIFGLSFRLKFTEVTNTYEITDIYSNIKIDVSTYNINIILSNNDENKIVYKGNEKVYIETYVKNNTLVINHVDNRMFYERFSDFGEYKLDLYLNQSSIDLLNIECSTGDITIDKNLTFSNIDIKSSTGDLNINKCEVLNSINIEVSTGDIELVDVNCSSLNIESSTGSSKLINTIVRNDFYLNGDTGDLVFDAFDANNIEVNLSTGDVKGTILTNKFFVVKTSTGDISVPETKDGGTCRITTSTGDINIRYK